MSASNLRTGQLWPRQVKVQTFSNPVLNGFIDINSGITTLVGPNGTGKTRALRAIKANFEDIRAPITERHVYHLAAGRIAPLEQFRSMMIAPKYIDGNDAAVGSIDYQRSWYGIESITGVFLAIEKRPDLRMKVESRLQQLFDRRIRLNWSQSGLQIYFSSMNGGAPYTANVEASGILQLVGLLGAIHNDEIGVLIIDEPEISLHPQHQAFILEEMEAVAGDPSDPKKKLIVIATHSASFLTFRELSEIPNIVFFNSSTSLPTQVASDDNILKRRKLAALVARLSTTHRLAMFAERVLLVEGPSDEIIVSQLARKFELRTVARNAHILPVTGKGEFGEATKLFRAMNKEVAVLADLDALSDSNELVSVFSELPYAAILAQKLGRSSLLDLDRDLRTSLPMFISRHQADVDAAASSYPDWSSKESSPLAKNRVTLARVLTDPESFGSNAATDARALHNRYEALLNALEAVGCFFLRKGAIENYFSGSSTDKGKPERAAEEAETFGSFQDDDLKRNYAEAFSALTFVAPSQQVDEDRLLRPKLGAAIMAVLLGMDLQSSDDTINSIAEATIGKDAEIFKFSNISSDKTRIRVQILSPLFSRKGFPFEIGRDDNPSQVITEKLPGLSRY